MTGIVQQMSPAWSPARIRQLTLLTDLGPCAVTVQEGSANQSPVADVYLHGAAGTWATFTPLLSHQPLRDRVLIDLPGWGASTKGARLEHLSVESISHAVMDVLVSLGYVRWNLVGHSMGGFIALHLASAYPGRTASVATVSATTFSASRAARAPLEQLTVFPSFVGMLLLMRFLARLGSAGSALVRAVASTPLIRLLMAPFFADPGGVSRDVLRALGKDTRPASFSVAARAAATYDFSQWRRIRCPAVAIRGDSDLFSTLADAACLSDLVPHLQPVTISRCGHFPHVEQPEQVERLLTALLAHETHP